MKTKTEIQKELIKEFGKNFNTIDNLIIWLKSNYHPQIFTSMEEFIKNPRIIPVDFYYTKKPL